MFKNEIKKSREIEKLEAFERRCPKAHPKYPKVAVDLAKALSGYQGEKSLEYYLSFLSDDDVILHDIRLQNTFNESFFQMDFVILTPRSIIIPEVKNITGEVTLDHKNGQLIYKKEENEYILPDPILQVQHQRRQFMAWLKKMKFPQIPIETLVVFTKKGSKLKMVPDYGKDTEMVIRSSFLLSKLDDLNKIHRKEILSKKDLRKFSNLLLKHNIPRDIDLFGYYQIKESDILTGVYCPYCFSIPMVRKLQKWFCPICKLFSKDAHLDTMKDFSLLYKSTITIRELRNFLQLSTNNEAHYIFKKMHCPHTGGTKGRVYTLPF